MNDTFFCASSWAADMPAHPAPMMITSGSAAEASSGATSVDTIAKASFILLSQRPPSGLNESYGYTLKTISAGGLMHKPRAGMLLRVFIKRYMEVEQEVYNE